MRRPRNEPVTCNVSEPPIGIEPMTYALRECSRALLAGSRPALPSGSASADGGDRWLLMAVRGHLGDTGPPLSGPDISPVGTDRASVMRCRRSPVVAGGCCCCCHRCCQPGQDAFARLPSGVRLVTAPHRGGDGPVSWPGSLPGPWFLARVLPEARCQGWPKEISGGNAKRP